MTGPAAPCEVPSSDARSAGRIGDVQPVPAEWDGLLADELCTYREFARRMREFADARPQARWHLEGSSRRIHTTLQEACRHLRRGDTVVDLGCLPPNMIYGFHVAGLLPHLHYVGTCLEGPGDGVFEEARSLGVRLERVDLDPRFSLYEDLAGLPTRLPLSDGSVDVILLTEVLEHLVWPHSVLDECARLLKPNGALVGSTPNATNIGVLLRVVAGLGAFEWYGSSHLASARWMKHVRFYSFGELEHLLADHGLRLAVRRYVSFADVYAACAWPRRAMGAAVRKVFHLVPWYREKLFFSAAKRPARPPTPCRMGVAACV